MSSKYTPLIDYAKNGNPRPKRNTDLGNLLFSLSQKPQTATRQKIYNELRTIAPVWFDDLRKQQAQEELLTLAKSGIKRSEISRYLNNRLRTYITKSSTIYDEAFDKKIKEVRPEWFNTTRREMFSEAILELAKSGAQKPKSTDTLWSYYNTYVRDDTPLKQELMELRPDWFVPADHQEYKNTLLEMAKNGERRPYAASRLGHLLNRYLWPHNYQHDPEFIEQIKKIRPDWFRGKKKSNNQPKRPVKSESIRLTLERKAELLEIARNKGLRPDRTKEIGIFLSMYISPSSNTYDPVFVEELKAIAPSWFIDRRSIVSDDDLLLIAQYEEFPTGRAGVRLTKRLKDDEFRKRMYAVRPEWLL